MKWSAGSCRADSVSLGLSENHKLQFSKQASGILKRQGNKGGKLHLAIAGTITLRIVVNLAGLGYTAIPPVFYLTTLFNRFDGFSA